MLIHKSHSKKNMIDMFDMFDITLDKGLIKNELIKSVITIIKDDNIKFKDNHLNIKNKNDLINYLENENTECKIDSIEKDKVMLKCKKIIHFAKCKYNMNASQYNNIEEVFNDCMFISRFGFIPSVRRACKLHNECVFKVNHINPVMSQKTLKQLENKKVLNKTHYYNLGIKQGKFIISFD